MKGGVSFICAEKVRPISDLENILPSLYILVPHTKKKLFMKTIPKINPDKIKNILFDLGGVIYDIDPLRTQRAIEALIPEGDKVHFYSKTRQIAAVSLYESGKISTAEFIQTVRATLSLQATDLQIIEAWNALLVGVVKGRVEKLDYLSQYFNLALLSNTNELHYDTIFEDCQPVYAQMQQCFFSFQMGMRKPNAEIFEAVLSAMQWEKEETLFVEDSPPNIEGAIAVGLSVFPINALSDFDHLVDFVSKEVRS